MASRMRSVIAVVVLLIAVGAGVLWWEHRRAERAEARLGLDAARVLTATFSRTNQLKVSELNGEVLAQSDGASAFGMIPAQQRSRAPYSVSYFVDLSGLSPQSMRCNARDRILSVEVPDVVVAKPAVDYSKAQVTQTGLYISRKAGIAMQQQANARLAAKAQEEARKPDNVLKARAAAREAVAANLRAPLAAAGYDNVTVSVRLAGDPQPPGITDEQWDLSRSISEVYADFKD